jgi:hypothetical protein
MDKHAGSSSLRTLVMAAALAMVPLPAFAHGLPAAILGATMPSGTGEAPRFMFLTEGFAAKHGEVWRYICPSKFATEFRPPAVSPDGERLYVAGGDDLYVMDADGTVDALEQPQFSERSVTTLLTRAGGLFAFLLVSDGAELWRVDGASSARVWSGDRLYRPVSSADGGFWLARVEGTVATLLHLEMDGSPGAQHELQVDEDARIENIAVTSDAIYVSTIRPLGDGVLFELRVADGAVSAVLHSRTWLSGPVLVDGGPLWIGAEGRLLHLASGVGVADAGIEGNHFMGIGVAGTLSYASTGTQLYRLDASGIGERLFGLNELEPPEQASSGDACSYYWEIFQEDLAKAGVVLEPADAGAMGGPTRDDRSSTAQEPSGCTLTGRPGDASASGWLFALALLAASRRRRPFTPG